MQGATSRNWSQVQDPVATSWSMRECHDPCEIQATHSRRTNTIIKKKISPEIELNFPSLQQFSTGILHVSLHPSSACHRHILSSGFLCSNVLSLREFSLSTGGPRASSASDSRCIPPTSFPLPGASSRRTYPPPPPLLPLLPWRRSVGRKVRGPGHQDRTKKKRGSRSGDETRL
jgi:hypothetical protein